jgi:hypothetical protein
MTIKSVKKITTNIKTKVALGVISIFSVFPVFAGGLSDATDAANEAKTWAYGFLGVIVFLFLIYKVIMALIDKETWGDVLMALGKVAMAGGVIVAAEWAWAIFGG